MKTTILPATEGFFCLFGSDDHNDVLQQPVVAWQVGVGEGATIVVPLVVGVNVPFDGSHAVLCPDGKVVNFMGDMNFDSQEEWLGSEK